MKFALATAALSAMALAAPAPDVVKRDNIDGVVLNFALTLEHLEAEFYTRGFRRFSSAQLAAAGFSGNSGKDLKQIGNHENRHVEVLTTALRAAGVQPVAKCSYDFGLTTPAAFVALASVLENVGVAAYAGAAQLITSKAYLTTAATILGVEAEHVAFLRSKLDQSPFAQPFTPALSVNQVWSLASQFINSCPRSNPTLPVKAYPRITVKNASASYSRGSQIRFTVPSKVNTSGRIYCAFLLSTGNIYSEAFRDGNARNIRCVNPKGQDGPMGQTFFVLTNSQAPVSDSNTIAGVGTFNTISPYRV